MQRSAFGRLHPAVAYAVGGGILSLAFLTKDPLSALLLAAGALTFGGECRGKTFVLKRLRLFLIITVACALTNPLISHRGVTILFYFGNNAVTLESALYGALSGAMLADVILWFEVLYRALPEDAALYYPAKLFPRATLIFSMAIRFVPRLMTRLREAWAAQRVFYPKSTVKGALTALQTGVALTLEESCEIAAGMEERGYGSRKRALYAVYRFRKTDAILVGAALLLVACAITGYILGAFRFTCYPFIVPGTGSRLWYLSPLALIFFPALIERKEKLLWRSSKSKM